MTLSQDCAKVQIRNTYFITAFSCCFKKFPLHKKQTNKNTTKNNPAIPPFDFHIYSKPSQQRFILKVLTFSLLLFLHYPTKISRLFSLIYQWKKQERHLFFFLELCSLGFVLIKVTSLSPSFYHSHGFPKLSEQIYMFLICGIHLCKTT